MTRNEFIEKFLNTFASNISKRQKKKIGICGKKWGYFWHLFSYHLVDCLKGDMARKEYDKVDKIDAIEIQCDKDGIGDEKTLILNKSHVSAEGVDKSCCPELYIIGKNFSWCYIITHEFDLNGPYFSYKPKENLENKQ